MISKFNLIYEKVKGTLIKEGGHVFEGVGPILKNNIKPTINYLENLIFKPLKIEKDMWTSDIGSVGKKDQSGDIDIAINMDKLIKIFNVESINDVKNILISKLEENGIETRKVGANIHLKFPIQCDDDSQTDEFVQIDFFPSKDLEYTKLNMFSPAQNESKYKGVHRGNTLASLIKAVSMCIADDAVDDEKNEYIDPDGRKYPGLRFSHISMGDDGFYQITKTFKGKKGLTKIAKKDDNKTKFITKSFQEILDILFGKGKYTISDISSFENIWNNILMDNSFPYKDKLDEIIISLYGIFKKDQHNIIPEEIINYIEENEIDVSNI